MLRVRGSPADLLSTPHVVVLSRSLDNLAPCFQKQQAIHGLQFEAAKTVTNLQQRVVDVDSDSSRAYNDKGYLPQTPKNFTDKADEWRSWQEEVADCVGTMTPGMLKVLAEIDQEMDVH